MHPFDNFLGDQGGVAAGAVVDKKVHLDSAPYYLVHNLGGPSNISGSSMPLTSPTKENGFGDDVCQMLKLNPNPFACLRKNKIPMNHNILGVAPAYQRLLKRASLIHFKAAVAFARYVSNNDNF